MAIVPEHALFAQETAVPFAIKFDIVWGVEFALQVLRRRQKSKNSKVFRKLRGLAVSSYPAVRANDGFVGFLKSYTAFFAETVATIQ